MINIKHRITVEKGKVKFSNLSLFNEDLRQYEEKEAYVTIRPYKNNRSDHQNRYYWGVVVKMLSDELGYFPDEMHEALKLKFLPKKTISMANESFIIADSSTRLSTMDFESFLSQIRTWASSDLGVLIPLPNDVEY